MRGKVFQQRVEKAGFDIRVYEQPKSKSRRAWQNEQSILSDWLKSLPKPVGIMACNDDRGQHVTEVCKTAGLKVPDEVAVIGVDNDELVCDLTEPPLSSLALNVEKGGYEAAELLDHLMSGKKITTDSIIVEPTQVVGRQSTDVLAIEDRLVSEALQFIRNNAKRTIQVADVVAVARVSRRSLEQRFRKILGRSINHEIRRVRVEQVARILIETNKSIGQIALDLGYPGVDHIARYFRAEKGISPAAYRKLHHR
jgi:LacI family transcriptional regulator